MNGSGDLSAMISKLTEDPEVMKTLMGIAGSLKNGNGDEKKTFDRFPREKEASADCNDGCDIRQSGDCREDRRRGKRGDDAENLIRLLLALKPYVGAERCEKIDGIVKILKLVRLSEQSGLLSSFL